MKMISVKNSGEVYRVKCDNSYYGDNYATVITLFTNGNGVFCKYCLLDEHKGYEINDTVMYKYLNGFASSKYNMVLPDDAIKTDIGVSEVFIDPGTGAILLSGIKNDINHIINAFDIGPDKVIKSCFKCDIEMVSPVMALELSQKYSVFDCFIGSEEERGYIRFNNDLQYSSEFLKALVELGNDTNSFKFKNMKDLKDLIGSNIDYLNFEFHPEILPIAGYEILFPKIIQTDNLDELEDFVDAYITIFYNFVTKLLDTSVKEELFSVDIYIKKTHVALNILQRASTEEQAINRVKKKLLNSGIIKIEEFSNGKYDISSKFTMIPSGHTVDFS
jgi:hypothetical protein